MKFNVKFVVVIMIVLAIVVGCTLTVVVINFTDTIESLTVNRAETANRALVGAISDYQDSALEMSKAISGFGDVLDAIKSGDGDNLQKILATHEGGLDFITVTDGTGIVMARSYSDKKGDDITNQKVIATAVSTGNGISAIEPGTQIPLAVRASTAIKDESGKLIAILSCGYDLSNPSHLDKIKEQSDCQVTIFAGDTRLSTTITDENSERVVGTQAAPNVVEAVIQNRGTYEGKVTLFGTQYQVCYTPLIVDGEVLGMLFSGVDIEDTAAKEHTITILIVIAAIMLMLEIVIVALVIRWTISKIYWYESLIDSIPSPISVTDMGMKWTFINKPVEQMLNVKRSDILGKHCSSWGAAICNTDNCGITCLKNGKTSTFFEQMGMDFKVDISYIHDARGKRVGHIEIVSDISDMMKTQKSQAEMVKEISQISHSFVEGSKQIADGAQALAQGSTEQAAVVEQLSASISDIAQKTKSNAEMAGRAATLAHAIKDNAEKGNTQMHQMTSAVKEINEASQSVNKVIKVIDDIAFQTNILALNAAVEAARAGQHGKGFAVVAEEVRNLAAKSAEAAKDTGGLIANSMEKAALGAKIAVATAASLEEIVSGINESNQIVSNIAESSNEQFGAIEQINNAINQVAQVVHQNSATSEQSAAASQELSGQSAQLDEIISRFEQDNRIEAVTATGFSIDS